MVQIERLLRGVGEGAGVVDDMKREDSSAEWRHDVVDKGEEMESGKGSIHVVNGGEAADSGGMEVGTTGSEEMTLQMRRMSKR